MSKIILLILALLAISTSAHSHRRFKRAVNIPASTCSYMTCAVSGGNCDSTGTSLKFCIPGEYCGSDNKCTTNIALGSACNPQSQQNECGSGSCVDSGNGPVCQIFREILPGNPCTADSQCFFSNDGATAVSSTCVSGVCSGKQNGEACSFSHQCYTGSFCSALTCQPLSQEGGACNNDSECSSRFTCLSNNCTKRFSQKAGQTCATTQNCAPGLYCKSGSCSAVKATTSSNAQCDISSNNCATDEQCACPGFTTSATQTATCSNVQGTATSMDTIQDSAFSCMDKNNCGSDLGNSSTLSCITSHCTKEFCTYFTRANSELFTQYPMCLVSRMVESSDYFKLIYTCSSYLPSNSQSPPISSDASSSFLSLSLALLIAFATFLF